MRLGSLNLRAQITRSGDVSPFWGRRFPKTIFLQMVLRAQPHVPRSTRGCVCYVWAEWKEERTPFPIQATEGKRADNVAVLRKEKPQPGGWRVNTTNNRPGLTPHVDLNTRLPRAHLSFLFLSSSPHSRKSHV